MVGAREQKVGCSTSFPGSEDDNNFLHFTGEKPEAKSWVYTAIREYTRANWGWSLTLGASGGVGGCAGCG